MAGDSSYHGVNLLAGNNLDGSKNLVDPQHF
jgi:hypothetical protein